MGLPEEDLAAFQVLPYQPVKGGQCFITWLAHLPGMQMVCRIPRADIKVDEVLADVRQQR
jgi:hypothetical protein